MWLFVLGSAVLAALFYKFFKGDSSNKDFWRKLGIREIDTSVVMSTLDLFLNRKVMTVKDTYAYKILETENGKFCGVWEMGKPMLLLKDMELIKRVLIKHFDHFVDRGKIFDEDDFVLRKILAALEGKEWKGVRNAISPTFTTGRIRAMMQVFNETSSAWVTEFSKICQTTGGNCTTILVTEAVNRYAMDVIATTAFGFNANVIGNPDTEFAKMTNRATDFSALAKIRFLLWRSFPILKKLTGMDAFDRTPVMWFDNILKQEIHSRLEGQKHRNDFIQLLVKAHKGELKADKNDSEMDFGTEKSSEQWLTDEVMRAQCVQFFFAGLNTVSGVLTFALYALALNPQVQDKLREEVGKIVGEDGSLDYDEVNKHVYLDMVVREVLRKFPTLLRYERVCTAEYWDEETGLVVPKGTVVAIPVQAIHNSKEYYEHPDKFYPDHFAADAKAARNPYAYMPFNYGPRNCIGMRFALTELKTMLAKTVHHFKVEPTPKTPVPLKTECMGLGETPPRNLELKLTLVNKSL